MQFAAGLLFIIWPIGGAVGTQYTICAALAETHRNVLFRFFYFFFLPAMVTLLNKESSAEHNNVVFKPCFTHRYQIVINKKAAICQS